jgi:streptogramin lyase
MPGPTSAEIFVMNIDGTGVTRLTFDPGTDLGPAWSPDGNKIVFTGVPFGASGLDEIFVMDADGQNRARLTVNTTGDFLADWQPLSVTPSLLLPASFDLNFVPPSGAPPVVAMFSASAVEEGSGPGHGAVAYSVFLRDPDDLRIPRQSEQIVTVSFLTNDAVPELAAPFVTATPVQDYIPRSGLLIFRPGEDGVPDPGPNATEVGPKRILVPLIDNAPGETNEVFTTVLFLPTNAMVAESIPDGIRPGNPGFGKITNQALTTPPGNPPVIREFEISTVRSDGTPITNPDEFAHGGGMAVAPDGAFWLSAQFNNKLTRFVYNAATGTGTSVDYPLDEIPGLPGSEYASMGLTGVFPHFLTIGSDGNLWGTGLNDAIFRVNLQNFNPAAPLNVTYFRNGITPGSTPHGILEDPLAPGIFWFAEESEEIFPEPGGGNKSHEGQSRIARLDSATGQITEFVGGLDIGARLHGFGFDLTAARSLWVGLEGPDQVARFDRTTMQFTDFVQFPRGTGPHALYNGPSSDHRLYVVLQDSNQIGVFNPQSRQVEEIISIPGLRVEIPSGMDAGVGDGPSIVQFVAGPDGGLWFTEFLNDRVGRLDLATLAVTEYAQGITPNTAPLNIVVGPDGNIWFSEPMLDRAQRARIAQIQVAGQVADALRVTLEVSATPFGPEISQRTSSSTFWVNAYVEDLRTMPTGVVGGVIDVRFNTLNLEPTGMRQFGTSFTLLPQGMADDANGVINETGALTISTGVGGTARAAFVAWEFRVTGNAMGSVAFTPEPGEGSGVITPAEFALIGQGTPVPWTEVEFVTATLDLGLQGDFDNSGTVDQIDLDSLIAHLFVPLDDPDYDPRFDLTGDGLVLQFDLAMFIPLQANSASAASAPAAAPPPVDSTPVTASLSSRESVVGTMTASLFDDFSSHVLPLVADVAEAVTLQAVRSVAAGELNWSAPCSDWQKKRISGIRREAIRENELWDKALLEVAGRDLLEFATSKRLDYAMDRPAAAADWTWQRPKPRVRWGLNSDLLDSSAGNPFLND